MTGYLERRCYLYVIDDRYTPRTRELYLNRTIYLLHSCRGPGDETHGVNKIGFQVIEKPSGSSHNEGHLSVNWC